MGVDTLHTDAGEISAEIQSVFANNIGSCDR